MYRCTVRLALQLQILTIIAVRAVLRLRMQVTQTTHPARQVQINTIQAVQPRQMHVMQVVQPVLQLRIRITGTQPTVRQPVIRIAGATKVARLRIPQIAKQKATLLHFPNHNSEAMASIM